MQNIERWMIGGVALLALAACDDTMTGSADTGLSGTQAQFTAMEAPCTSQAARLTGASAASVTVLDQIQTGGGPILTLAAGGSNYTCRLEADGSVTVFSEFAN
ncbi:hypothetical protein [Maritimibacter sp. UBA3975]|uniref:hypothetical protein n=1 Tax=Maritimibacter sp. UBA3975 TaxID=1946833 RepID=UPI000C09502C|nr:hypothetical protein [Maritimibacter sp. UBA3975]MAM61398.1 hypothetical protein [Maritimibacter sp.]|tara:strand:- start:76343 stop:76651 length:309 start_codon:yes stop_codon:yes gene_type:complete